MEMMTRTPNAAERQDLDSDDSFDVIMGYAGIAPARRSSMPGSKPRGLVETLSDSSPAVWVSVTFPAVVALVSSVTSDPESGEIFLSEREAFFLTQILNDLAELSEPVRSSASAKLCKRFAEGVGLSLANIPQARCAVFGDEEDGVELVAHSRASMRQVSFEFGDDERTINIVSIDEQMRRDARECHINHVLTLAEAVAWLNPH